MSFHLLLFPVLLNVGRCLLIWPAARLSYNAEWVRKVLKFTPDAGLFFGRLHPYHPIHLQCVNSGVNAGLSLRKPLTSCSICANSSKNPSWPYSEAMVLKPA